MNLWRIVRRTTGLVLIGVSGWWCSQAPAEAAQPTVVSWGCNGSGQGDIPVGLSNILALAAGISHSLALKADGTVTCWGDNSLGQCNVPADLTNAVAIAAGGYHSMALRNDGTVVTWGTYWDSISGYAPV